MIKTNILLLAHLKDLKASNVKHTNEEGTSVLEVLSETTYKIWSLNNLSWNITYLERLTDTISP